MSKYAKLIVAYLFLVLGFTACKKGDAGPLGPQGEQGERGERGERGIAGADGSTIYNGTAAPASTLGKEGDYYLNRSTSQLYGPKTGSGWGTPINLRGQQGATGAQGAAGANGSKILSGTSTPSTGVGVAGDYYLNRTTYQLYGPKTAAGWGTPISLQGATGPQGPAGPQGPTGTANVIYSPWTALTFSSIPVGYHRFWSVPGITAANVNSIMVMVYWKSPSGYVNPLPYETTTGERIHFSISTSYSLYLVSELNLVVTGYNEFRYVIIPGGISATANLSTADLMHYDRVAAALGLPN
ncbi:hypothetical protein [Parapedobacter tibetensis]|uniref:hypothetical protein n=1 Tax=Parapedobacter tibetensis TaxID=2972951 RepID=UPI00214D7640|nr:hypothetical protein [Parapedobacter tibetensis]